MAKNVVVVGTQWGDEGKGKIVDWLTDHASGVVRFQGGHNAYFIHWWLATKLYKLNLVPRYRALGDHLLYRQRRRARCAPSPQRN